jgi:small-conductance mechanosensitive channel
MIISEIRLKVSRRVNLGNYEHVEVEVTVTVNRADDAEKAEELRETALTEVDELLADALDRYTPRRRSSSRDDRDR